MFNINSLFQTIDKKALNFKTENFSIEEDYSIGKRVVEVLKSFKVFVEHIETEVGPVITSIYVKPKLGVRIADVEVLEDDLCIALGADRLKVQIAPEKKAIAIEIPTSPRKKIPFGNILYSDTSNKILPATLGIDTRGNPINIDIADTPHLLIAGQTGSGKSVCLNAIITSLALNATPFDLQFLLIDPKRVEFSLYNDLPNLIGGYVINEIDEAMQSLQWLIQEMERRNLILAKSKCRKLSDFKQKLMTGDIAEIPKELADNIPYIVAVIDEYADLMMRSEKELTECIMKLAQKARNVGIHLILATQRPSSKILTGDIKANIPTRIALKVASSVDSKTIIDYGGAEKLLGKGDMILKNSDGKEKRIHGCFLSDDEIEKSVAYLKEFFKDNVFRFNQPNVFDTPFEQYEKEVSQHGVLGLFTGTCSSILNQLSTKKISLFSAQEEIYDIITNKLKTDIDDKFAHLVLNFKENFFTRIITLGLFDYETEFETFPFAERIVKKAFTDENSIENTLIEECIKEDYFDWLPKLALEKAIKEKNLQFIVKNQKILESSTNDLLECRDEDTQEIILKLAENGVQSAKEIIYKTTFPPCSYCKILGQWCCNGDTEAIKSFFEIDMEYDREVTLETRSNIILTSFMNLMKNDFIEQIIQGDRKESKQSIYQIIKNGFFSDAIRKLIIKWVKERDERAKEIVYQKAFFFSDLIREFAEDGDRKAINIIYQTAEKNNSFSKIIESWANNGDVKAIDFIYQKVENTKDSYKEWLHRYNEIIRKWANDGSFRAKKIIYSNPTIFNNLIKEWAKQRDENAISCIFQCSSSFPELIKEWAIDRDEKILECIYKLAENAPYLHIYNDIIATRAKDGDDKAKDFVYKHPERFVNLITVWVNQNDEKAFDCIYQSTEHTYYFIDIIQIRAKGGDVKAKEIAYNHPEYFTNLIEECVNQKELKAKDCVYQHPTCFANLIKEWVKQKDEKAIEAVYQNPEFFTELIREWAKQNNEKAQKIIYQITRDYLIKCPYHLTDDNTHKYGIQLITENAQNGDYYAKETIYQIAEEHFYNLPYSFKELVEKWAKEDDNYAKKLIYQHPKDFTKLIEKWANEKDKKAIDCIYAHPLYFSKIIEEWWLNCDNDFSEEYIYQNSYAFTELIGRWAGEGNKKAIELVYQNPLQFSELLNIWATERDDSQAAEIICENLKEDLDLLIEYRDYDFARTEFFKLANGNDEFKKEFVYPYIVQYAKQGDDEAKKIILEHYSDMSFEQFKKLYPSILKWGEENENARKIYCEHFGNFSDWYTDIESLSTIFDWAIKGDGKALEFISRHIWDFEEFVKDYLMKKANR